MNAKKILAMILAVVLLMTATIAGTIAWLKDSTQTVTNTFTSSDINIDLTETTGEEYKMVPGETIEKDPKVTVEAGSEGCYLFVKIEKSSNYDTYLEEYVVADGWTAVGTTYPGVYWRTANAGDTFSVLKDNQVKVLTTVTKTDMEAIDGVKYDEDGQGTTTEDATEIANRPTLTFTAYAIQFANLVDADGNALGADDIATIWAMASSNP